MTAFLRRLVLVCAGACAVPLAGAAGPPRALASAGDVCAEGTRSLVDVRDAMQPFVDAVGESVKAGDDSEERQVAVGGLAGRAYNAVLVAASRIDSANSLEDLGEVTEDGDRLVAVMHSLAEAIAQSNFTYVAPVIPEYNEAQAAFASSCQDHAPVVGGLGGGEE